MNCKKHYEVPDAELKMTSYTDVLLSSGGTPLGDGYSDGFDNPFNMSNLMGGGN